MSARPQWICAQCGKAMNGCDYCPMPDGVHHPMCCTLSALAKQPADDTPCPMCLGNGWTSRTDLIEWPCPECRSEDRAKDRDRPISDAEWPHTAKAIIERERARIVSVIRGPWSRLRRELGMRHCNSTGDAERGCICASCAFATAMDEIDPAECGRHANGECDDACAGRFVIGKGAQST